MKVKLNTAVAGNKLKDGQFAGHFAWAVGEVVEMSDTEARAYIERGMATPVNQSNK